MSALRLVDVAFSHRSHDGLPERLLFDRLNLAFPKGWTAVVGPNGAGKTTLLRLLSGELSPSEGHVHVPPDYRIAHCRQAPDHAPTAVEAFAERWDADARRARARWSLRPEELARWPTLSHGERKRWQVAAALDTGADVLLLDEPTNHLDLEARAQLIDMLSAHRGVGVAVAHDRDFLNTLASRTVWLEEGRGQAFEAGLDAVRAQREATHAGERKAHADRRKQLGRLERERQARRERLQRAEASRSARRRMKSPRDADGRSVNRKARADAAAASHARARAQMERRTERAERALGEVRLQGPLGSALAFDALPGRSVRIETNTKTFLFEKDARIWLAGPNGSGKSTLLKSWVAAWPDDAVVVLPQEMSAADRRAARERIARLPPQLRGRTLSCLAALGVPPRQAMDSPCPSPGEGRKMALAEGLARGARWLLLDEPTHHLDLPSVERLQTALCSYRGGLVLVTHDRALAAACTDTTWHVRAGAVEVG